MKESLFKISKGLLMAVALIELAISQIHIEMITKLFVRDVGFFLFLFIISGMLILFNLSSMAVDVKGKLKQFMLSVLVAIGSGVMFIVFAWKDYLAKESIELADVRLSLIIILIGIIIYLIGSISIFATYLMHTEDRR